MKTSTIIIGAIMVIIAIILTQKIEYYVKDPSWGIGIGKVVVMIICMIFVVIYYFIASAWEKIKKNKKNKK